ncbi:hypothetical protein X777_13682 [Ooceraea biroi]|uniref:Uncharacterized protein n=1 Tax=Ooceraea biroi TaxID=2015173 RepID=A0A026VXH5_OOCBI|nr:hypothetical protein X777_13682 [Ooceraea biroi]
MLRIYEHTECSRANLFRFGHLNRSPVEASICIVAEPRALIKRANSSIDEYIRARNGVKSTRTIFVRTNGKPSWILNERPV